jgi:hypothetical protein
MMLEAVLVRIDEAWVLLPDANLAQRLCDIITRDQRGSETEIPRAGTCGQNSNIS